jgi:hypothetical protein
VGQSVSLLATAFVYPKVLLELHRVAKAQLETAAIMTPSNAFNNQKPAAGRGSFLARKRPARRFKTAT